MQERNVHPIYFYRFNFDTKEAIHRIIYRNEVKGDFALVFYFIPVLNNQSF